MASANLPAICTLHTYNRWREPAQRTKNLRSLYSFVPKRREQNTGSKLTCRSMHQRHLAFSRPGRTHAHAHMGASHKGTCDHCAVSRQCGADGGYSRQIPRSARRIADPGGGTRRLYERVRRVISRLSAATMRATALARWRRSPRALRRRGIGTRRSNWTQDKGPRYWRSSLPCRHARPVRFDMAISRARISSGVGMAVDILSVDSCAVNSSSRPISAARTSRASAQLGADGVCCSPSQPVPWRTPSQTG